MATCTVVGCDSPSRKRTWCASHYAQWYRSGKDPVPFSYKWSARVPCLVCGADSGHYREFCSANCRRMHRLNRPDTTRCVSCHVVIDLHALGKKGQRRKACIKFCARCKSEYGKYKLTAAQLAERDGAVCRLCDQPVDMGLRRSESNMCASVDHILPRSMGGTHEPENLQLAHLYCNQAKSDRVTINEAVA